MSGLLSHLEVALTETMRFLPVSWTSGIGAKLGELTVKKAEKNDAPWVRRFNANVEHLCNAQLPSDQQALLHAYGEQVGRLYAEYTILQKMSRQGRIEIDGEKNLQNLTKPVVFTSPHLANWEVIFQVFAERGEPTCVLYEPREGEARMKIANRARLAWGDNITLASTQEPMVMRKLDSLLREKSNLYILADEEKSGFVFSPSLGRDLPYAGNRWMLSRLAARHLIDVVPLYVTRFASTRFKIHIDPKITPDPNLERIQRAKQISDQIDQKFDRWVRQKPEHWYWLPQLDFNVKRASKKSG